MRITFCRGRFRGRRQFFFKPSYVTKDINLEFLEILENEKLSNWIKINYEVNWIKIKIVEVISNNRLTSYFTLYSLSHQS